MATQSIKRGFNSGIAFSVIIIFMALTGFTFTIAGLIGKILGIANLTNLVPYVFTVHVILGLWNGNLTAKSYKDEATAAPALISSLSAGVFTGLLVAGFSWIYGWLLSNEIDPRPYLSMVSPDSMRMFLYDQGTMSASIIHLAVMTFSGLVGGFLSYYLKDISIRDKIYKWSNPVTDRINRSPWFKQVFRSSISIYILFALVAVLTFLLPRVWGSYWNYIVGTIGIYVIMGLGLNIIVGLAGQLVLGYVAFFAIGAYSMALLTAPEPHALGTNFWVSVVISIILAALTGILLGLPLMRLRGDYLAIVTLGFGEIIRIMLRSDVLTPLTAGPRGVRDIGGPTLFGQPFKSDIDFVYLIAIAVLIIMFVTHRLQNSRTGRAWVAIREDEVAAKATGINTFQSKLLALAIGAAFAGLGGALFASRNQFTGPEDHIMMVSINVLCIVIVGGMGSIPGVILGAIVLKGFPEMLRELDVYRLMVFGALLVGMMVIRPEGLMPAKSVQLEQQFVPGISKSKGTSEQGAPKRSPEESCSIDPDSQNSPGSNGGDHDSLS
jgi:ABC-type branched-subunit amino acid transport system permease subunit